MSLELVRVRDFAQNCGCTPQNVYGHLKKYAKELEGHTYQGKGRQGLLLDDYAQKFLRSIMYPKDLAPSAVADEVNRLRAQILQLGVSNTELASRLAATEGERDRAQMELQYNQRALAAANEVKEAQEQELAQARQDAQTAQETIQASQAQIEQLQAALAAQEAKNEALMQRGFWARLRNKGVD